MKIAIRRSASLFVGTIWMFASGYPAFGDDTELFITDASNGVNFGNPNILFIMDTSGSMDADIVTQANYDPEENYSGSCEDDHVYWRSGTGDPPGCGTSRWFERSSFMCDAAIKAFDSGAGTYIDRMAQYDPGWQDRWERIDNDRKTRLVECEDDGGVHGRNSSDDEVYAQNGNDSEPWSADAADEVSWGAWPTDVLYTVFDGNYLNWYHGPTGVSTRIQVVKDVATDLLSSVNGVNVGLMRFNWDAGGPVIHAMEDIATARTPMTTTINALPASGWTPLSETLYEAGQYYAGRNVVYGDVQGPPNSISTSRLPGNSSLYNSPMELGCQKNFVVLLTDGEPTQDTGADTAITSLPSFGTLVGGSCDGSGNGACLDDMAEYMFKADLNPGLPGQQNVTTYTIGFTVDLPILASTAARGGGAYFTADDTASLSTALTNIVTSILDTESTFVSPTVSVNSFNRAQTLNDLFINVFQATGDVHWPGNLKKYRLRASDGTIVDQNGNPAVDPATGFFADSAQSFWSSTVDGRDVTQGGAANQIPVPAARSVYTYLGNAMLTSAGNRVELGNSAIDDALLGIGQTGDPARDDVIDYIRGVDITDVDQDNNVTEPRYQMGDPLHSKPHSVIYGGTVANPDVSDAVVYFATNDGYLHAIDPNTGVEKWAFIPPEFMPDQVALYKNETTNSKHYGIDGNITVQQLADKNGVIEPAAGEKVYLYFGARRGGSFYYGLDVTDPDNPMLLWSRDSNSLADLGQSWSTPMPTRVNIDQATQNDQKMVLIFGGGYDPTQDNNNSSLDTSGNSIFMLDSVSGDLLWRAGETGADRNLAKMQYSIPANVRVIDLDGDKFADRMYASDMGGQVWRFDIFNGQPRATLVNGGVIAQLGSAPADPAPLADTRRFYYAPDAALVNDRENNYVHIGIGSGHRAHPNSVFTQDRFYAIRDHRVFAGHTQPNYDAMTPITDADLIDVSDDVDTDVPPGSDGWKLELRDGGWQGEKVLAETRTFDNKVYFTTFIPGGGASANSCVPALGSNRLYIMDILNGAPVNNLDQQGDDDDLTLTDRYYSFRGSISSEVVFLFPEDDDDEGGEEGEECAEGEDCDPPDPVACVDLFCFDPGFENNPMRTFWSQENVQ
jgi:type IV pilus assembly protein PilY1